MSEDHPAYRHRAGNGALFASSKFPPGPGLENSCELPFGFIYTPLAPNTDATVVPYHSASLPAVLCLTCLSYLNLYATFDHQTGIWECPLCGAKNVAPTKAFEPDGPLTKVLVSPMVEYRQPLATYNNNVCNIILVLDINLPRDEAQAVGTTMQAILPELVSKEQPIHLGLVVFGKTVSIYQLGVSGMASADVFVSHETLTPEHLKSQAYLTDVAGPQDTLDSLLRCLSAVYGISLENEKDEETANIANPPVSRMERLRQRKQARLRQQQQQQQSQQSSGLPKSPWMVARQRTEHAFRCTGEAVQCAMDLAVASFEQQSPRTSRIFLFTNGCPNYGDGNVVVQHHDDRAKVDVVDPLKLSRAVQYFDVLAKAALEGGIGMDVFCTGASELSLPCYQALVEPSAGYVLPHETFASNHLSHNIEFLLKHTFVSGTELEDYTEQTATPSSENDENWIDGCIVDLRMASFLTPTHIVGPGELVEDIRGVVPNELSAFALGSSHAANQGMQTNNLPSQDMLDTSLTRVRMGRYDPLSTFSVMLQENDFFQRDQYAFFQCTVRFVDRDGKTLVTRVSTHRLSIAKDVGEYLDSIDDEVIPVLLGKEAVYRSMFGREVNEDVEVDAPNSAQLENLAYDAQSDLDATISRISGAFRLLGLEKGSRGLDLTEEGGVKAAGSSFDFAFPPELADALRRLYHLRRGPLLCPGPMQSSDDRAEIRSLFIRLPLEDCMCMMAPSLWTTGPLDRSTIGSMPALEECPPDTLVLWEKSIVAADYYHSLFIWSGSSTVDPEFVEVRRYVKQFLLSRSKNRFPMPQMHVVAEDDSMSRRFTALLAPSHGDPLDHQLAHFPALATLAQEEVATLRSKFRFYDPATDPSFRSWFWNVASATSTSKDEGVSLCE